MNSNNFGLSILIALVLLHQGILNASGNLCLDRSPRWKDLGGDYCYIIETYEAVSWTDAVYKCFVEGGSLASFHSAEELERVLDEVRNYDVRLYMGLRKNNDGSFQWVDQTPVNFTRWHPGEPNIDYEKCGEIWIDLGQWNDIECSRKFQYVCSVPKSKPLPFDERRLCPSSSADWIELEGDACYIIEVQNKTTWPEALRRCNEKGGSLASFHSIEEISAVVQRTKSYSGELFIGLKETDEDGIYSWVDQSAMDLDYWGITTTMDYLNDVPSVQEKKCGVMHHNNGEWSEVSCGASTGYICSAPIEIACGGNIVGRNGFLKSPNYPDNYGPNEYCEWTITVSQDFRIILNFLDFDVQFSGECKRDYVEIRDGHNSTSRVLERFCGSIIPTPVYSTGNTMKVIFRSNRVKQFVGFLAEFQEDDCGGTIFADTGTFTSPNFPDRYRSNANCIWKITVPEGYRIILAFPTFKLEGGYNCRFDRVEIRDGQQADSPLLGQFCGNNKPQNILSSTNELYVKFVSDDIGETTGFTAAFTKVGSDMEDLGSPLLR